MTATDSHLRPQPDSWPILVAMLVLSAGMLAFELTLTRLFAVAQFHHLAFMAVSLALLGLGAAGSLLTVRPTLGREPGRWSAAFAAAVLVSFAVLNTVPFDSYAIAWDRRQFVFLFLTLAAAALPFGCSGLAIASLLARDVRRIHRLYGANMLGSALGSLATPLVVDWVGAEGAILIEAALGLVAAALFWLQAERGSGQSDGHRALPASPQLAGARFRMTACRGGLALAASLLLVGLALARPSWLQLRLSPYKALSQALTAADARITFSDWGPTVRLDVVESRSIHQLPGLSQNALLPRPPLQAGLTLDGDNLTAITHLSPASPTARQLADSVPSAVARQLRPEAAWLILQPGGGFDVLLALAGGVSNLTVVERHPEVARVLADQYGPFTYGLYRDRRVRLVTVEGRTFIRRSQERYGVLELALSDSFHPVASGAYSLTEDYRYTVEAMADYLDHLTPDGILLVTRWLQTPPTESLRLIATVQAALRRQGATDPGAHLAAFRSLRTMTLVVGRRPLGRQDRATIRRFAASGGYDLVWLADLTPGEVNRYQELPQPAYYQAVRALLQDPTGFVATHEFDIRPPTDDRPFFFHYFRWRQTPAVLARLGRTWQPFGGSGYLVLVVLLAMVSIMAGGLTIGPLMLGRVPPGRPETAVRSRLRVLVYYSGLGLGYLFVLLPMAQRFILFIGGTVTALAVVFFALLLFSGLGSLTAPRWRLTPALLALLVAIAATDQFLTVVFDLALGWPLAWRVLTAVAMLAPLGLLLGIPFARGMLVAEAIAPGITPWAWAVNSAASVVAGVVAMMIAVGWGFGAVLWCAVGAYGLALLAIRPLATAASRE